MRKSMMILQHFKSVTRAVGVNQVRKAAAMASFLLPLGSVLVPGVTVTSDNILAALLGAFASGQQTLLLGSVVLISRQKMPASRVSMVTAAK